MAGRRTRVTGSDTARGAAVTRAATAGGAPVASLGTSPEEQTTQDRLAAQREAQEAREEAEARTAELAASAGLDPDESEYTAVCRNGLPHRRNGVMFGDQPVTVDVTDWTEEQKQEFFGDGMLMIVTGRSRIASRKLEDKLNAKE